MCRVIYSLGNTRWIGHVSWYKHRVHGRNFYLDANDVPSGI
jgi:hypothetical protein